MKVRTVSPAFRRDYWTRNGDEPDATILWPGARQALRQWLAGESPIVIAALKASREIIVASRCVFSRSQTLRDLWYYGYFFTLPNFRRQGLGERVMREGLAEIGRAGAHYCSCYVADENQASADLAIKLGFQRLPFVRVVFRPCKETATEAIHHHPAETYDVRELPGAMNLIERVVGGEKGSAVLIDELLVRRPWQPWKSVDSRIIRLKYNGDCLGICRIGAHKTVLIIDPESLLQAPEGILLSLVASVCRASGRPVFAFLPCHVAEKLLPSEPSCQIYNVFWNDRIGYSV